MRKPVRALLYFVLPAAFGVAACSDSGPTSITAPVSTAPVSQNAQPTASHLLGGLLGGDDGLLDGLLGIVFDLVSRLGSFLVPPVVRSVELAADVTWSFYAGPNGATSSNSYVGLTIAIPRGALASTQRITVTALKGRPVAYKFEPHGLVFARPVILTQNLRGTSANALLQNPLSAGYFATDRVELSDGLASVSELLSAVVLPGTSKVAFPIKHFSGYIVASGRADTIAEGELEGR